MKKSNANTKSTEFGDNTKLCGRCHIRKKIDQFTKSSPLRNVKYYSLCKECKSFAKRLAKYGITKEDYIKKIKEQNFCCKICKQKESSLYNLAVDHNHLTGEIRGLLCYHCNMGLGFFKDNTDLLNNTIKYIEEYTK